MSSYHDHPTSSGIFVFVRYIIVIFFENIFCKVNTKIPTLEARKQPIDKKIMNGRIQKKRMHYLNFTSALNEFIWGSETPIESIRQTATQKVKRLLQGRPSRGPGDL